MHLVQPASGKSRQFEQGMTVKSLSELVISGNVTRRILELHNEANPKPRRVVQLQMTSWPDHGMLSQA